METLPKTYLKDNEVRDTLNKGGGKTDNEYGTKFKPLANVNIWSFRKPYATDLDLFYLTDEQIRSINCGFTALQIASPTSLPNVMDGNMNGWVYNLPTGGQYFPYRIGDYAGYYPEARPMIRDIQVPAEVSLQEYTDIAVTAVVQVESDKKSVSLADLGKLQDCYACVYMTYNDEYRIIEGNPISGGTFNVGISMDELNREGEWMIYPYLSNGSVNYTIPNLAPQKVKVTSSNYRATMTAFKATDGTRTITWNVYVRNTSSQSFTFNDNYVWLRLANKSLEDTLEGGKGEKMVKIEDGLVAEPNNTTLVASGSFTNVSDEIWMMPKLWVTLHSGNYTGSAVPIEEMG